MVIGVLLAYHLQDKDFCIFEIVEVGNTIERDWLELCCTASKGGEVGGSRGRGWGGANTAGEDEEAPAAMDTEDEIQGKILVVLTTSSLKMGLGWVLALPL